MYISKSNSLSQSTFYLDIVLLLNFLEYKLADRGKIFQKVDKWFPSSQLCSCCGNRKKLELSQRVYVCEQCGLSIDRDQTSAINIKMEGLRILGEALLGKETG